MSGFPNLSVTCCLDMFVFTNFAKLSSLMYRTGVLFGCVCSAGCPKATSAFQQTKVRTAEMAILIELFADLEHVQFKPNTLTIRSQHRSYFQFLDLPLASHSRVVAMRFARVSSRLASMIHSTYSLRWL